MLARVRHVKDLKFVATSPVVLFQVFINFYLTFTSQIVRSFFFFFVGVGCRAMVFNLYHSVYLKYVRTHCTVTKTKLSLFFSRLKPDNSKFFSTLDNNQVLSIQNINIACFKNNALSTAYQSKILLLLQSFLHLFLFFLSLIPIALSVSHKTLTILLQYFLKCQVN